MVEDRAVAAKSVSVPKATAHAYRVTQCNYAIFWYAHFQPRRHPGYLLKTWYRNTG